MTVVERMAELRQHVDHLRQLEPRVSSASDLEENLSLHNDVLFSLLMIAQLVIDVAGELCSAAGLPFEDYTNAVRNLSKLDAFSPALVEELSRLPGFRNVLIHDYLELDYDVVVQAIGRLQTVDEFIRVVSEHVAAEGA